MNLYLVTCLVVAASYKTEGCCTPDQWEGKIGEIGGLARKSFYRPPQLFGGEIALSYDATNEKVAAITYKRGTMVRTIGDYSAHRIYAIRNTTCMYFNMTQPFRKFCTDNATATGTAFYGGGAATLQANTWSYRVMGLQGYASTTQDDCLPIGETLHGKIKRDYIIMTVGYYNITTGIKDPSIFDPPAGCQPGAGDLESHLDSLDVPEVKYIANKFHGEETPKLKDKYLRYEEKFQSLNDI